MSKSVLSLAVVVAMVAGSVAAEAQSQPTGSWPSGDSFNTGNGFTVGGSATDGTYLYVLGGYWSGTDSFRRYDPASDSWEDLEWMPVPNAYFRAAYVDGHVYMLGNGYWGDGEIYRYDLAGRFWSGSYGTLENNRYQAGAAVHGGKIYIAGGWDRDFGGISTALEVFDPADLSLTTLADMPQGLSLPFATELPQNGRIYFMGGSDQNGDSSLNLEYDPVGDAWQNRAPVSNGQTPQQRYFPGGFALNGRIYFVGGNNPFQGYSNQVFEYTPMTDSWVQRASMSNARYGFAFGVLGNEGWVYGGESDGAWYNREKFVAPDFGSLPDMPAAVTQVGSQPESSDQGGWTNNQVSFQANVTDPNAGQQVRLEVQVRASGSANWGPVLSSGNGPQGLRTVAYPVPANGPYDWRWRVADALNNVTPSVNGVPSWIEAFGNAVSPDFRSDQIAPSAPIARNPADVDVQVTSPASGPVTLGWTESTDNGPQSAISYEIQVAHDASFNAIEAQLSSSAGNSAMTVTLTVDRDPKFWRLRAQDIGGNLSAWSNVQSFRVTYNDGVDHASGDAKKGCGFTAAAEAMGSLTAALLGLALLAYAGRRVRKN